MQRLTLAGWLAAFLASIDPIGEALATATPNTFSHWLLGENVCIHGAKSTFESVKLRNISDAKFQLIILIRESLIGKISSFFIFMMIIR